jgi:hypothetical protein
MLFRYLLLILYTLYVKYIQKWYSTSMLKLQNKKLLSLGVGVLLLSGAATQLAKVYAHHFTLTLAQCREMYGQNGRMPICHATSSGTNVYVEESIPCAAAFGPAGHFNEDGTPRAGHEHDFIRSNANETCQGHLNPSPSPTASVEPSIEPSASPSASASPSVEPSVEPSTLPSASPSVAPSPSSSLPSPTPGNPDNVGHHSSLGTADVMCERTEFNVTYVVKDNGQPVRDVLVTFTFEGEVKQARTNAEGQANVSFGRRSGRITASADGWSTQSLSVTNPENCPDVILDPDRGGNTGGSNSGVGGTGGQVLGTSTNSSTAGGSNKRGQGQVLGATTLADTGSQLEMIMSGIFALGSVSTLVSGVALIKRK